MTLELRFYFGRGELDYDIIDTYNNYQLAYGMKKVYGNKSHYDFRKLKVVKV